MFLPKFHEYILAVGLDILQSHWGLRPLQSVYNFENNAWSNSVGNGLCTHGIAIVITTRGAVAIKICQTQNKNRVAEEHRPLNKPSAGNSGGRP